MRSLSARTQIFLHIIITHPALGGWDMVWWSIFLKQFTPARDQTARICGVNIIQKPIDENARLGRWCISQSRYITHYMRVVSDLQRCLDMRE